MTATPFPFRTAPIVALVALFLLPESWLFAQKSKLNKDAQALARILKPQSPAKKAESNSVSGLGQKMSQAIEILEKSYRTSGPTPESLIDKSLSFRSDIGKTEGLVLTNSLLEAWRAANAMGLVNERGEFEPVITKGRGVGEKTTFELIIPADVYPPASNQLANVRLVPLKRKRTEEAELTPREIATGRQLKAMIEERLESIEIASFRKGPKVNALGQSEAEQLEMWNAAVMNSEEDALIKKPKIRARGDMRATPSHATKNRWKVSCELYNQSPHPTEVTAEIWLIGNTDKKRIHFIMNHSTHDIKLRGGEIAQFEVFTKSDSSYKERVASMDGLEKKEARNARARFRGYAIKVTHSGTTVAMTATDPYLLSYIDPEDEDSDIGDLRKL